MAAKAPIRILIVEDHPIVVAGIRHLLAAETACKVIADVPDVTHAITLLTQSPPPDIAIVDIALRNPGTQARESGLDLLKWISARALPTRIIVLSMYDEQGYVWKALDYGVAGYVTKGTDLAGVVQAIRDAREGRRYVSEGLAPLVAAHARTRRESSPHGTGGNPAA